MAKVIKEKREESVEEDIVTLTDNPEETVIEPVAAEPLAPIAPADSQSAVAKMPTARSWLIVAVACGMLLALLIGFMLGGLVTVNRFGHGDGSREGMGGMGWMRPQQSEHHGGYYFTSQENSASY